MKLLLSLSLPGLCLGACFALTGCGGFQQAVVPDVAAQSSLGTLQGSVFGGHAPLVGSHVYVLEAGAGGYGSQATSLLGSGSSSAGLTANTSDPNVPAGWNYVTTDSTGSFMLTGEYKCDVGHPVYLYAYGGSPTYPSSNNVFPIASVTVQNVRRTGRRPNYTYTYEISYNLDTSASSANPLENFYIGEPVNITGMPSADSFLNQSGSQVIATQLTTTSFELSGTVQSTTQLQPYGTATPYTVNLSSAATATATPGFNSKVVNLAMLGNCPSATTGFAGTISYIYMNEVSTAAMATAMQPFTSSANNDAIHIGASSTNLQGIANAALMAGQLYDIQGSSVSTSYAGEGHIARATTTAGNGIVPQQTLDTLGNILAACVDSNNTAGTSSQCSTLFTYATNTGVPSTASSNAGTQPLDTATAAINIARHPAGVTSNVASQSTWVNTLYSLPTGNVPFTPNLTSAPADFSIAVSYPQSLNSSLGSPEGLAVDGSGNVWIDNASSGYITAISPLGAPLRTYQSAYTPGYVAIDPSNNIWWGPRSGTQAVTKISNNGTLLSGGGYAGAYAGGFTNPSYAFVPAIDGAGNLYLPDEYDTNNGLYTIEKLSNGGANAANSPFSGAATCLANGARPDHILLDNASSGSNLWITSENGSSICAFNSTTGAALTGYPKSVPAYFGNGAEPVQLGVDASNNLWLASYTSNRLYKLTTASRTLTDVTSGTTVSLNGAFSATVDGNGGVWVTNRGSNDVSYFENSGTAVTQTVNYQNGSGLLSTPLNAAVDGSGNLWITNYTGNSITQLVGAAGPVVTPSATAQGRSLLGQKP